MSLRDPYHDARGSPTALGRCLRALLSHPQRDDCQAQWEPRPWRRRVLGVLEPLADEGAHFLCHSQELGLQVKPQLCCAHRWSLVSPAVRLLHTWASPAQGGPRAPCSQKPHEEATQDCQPAKTLDVSLGLPLPPAAMFIEPSL